MDLLSRFALGEMDAFETLVRQFQGQVYGWIVRIVRDPGIAEDLSVETFWRIYRSRSQFRPDGNFGGWARRIATNLALDHLRRTRPERALPEDVATENSPDEVTQRETRDAIGNAFRRLPAKLRLTARLALIEEQPYNEIADALGTSVGTVKTRVFRAVRILRKHLVDFGVRQ